MWGSFFFSPGKSEDVFFMIFPTKGEFTVNSKILPGVMIRHLIFSSQDEEYAHISPSNMSRRPKGSPTWYGVWVWGHMMLNRLVCTIFLFGFPKMALLGPKPSWHFGDGRLKDQSKSILRIWQRWWRFHWWVLRLFREGSVTFHSLARAHN